MSWKYGPISSDDKILHFAFISRSEFHLVKNRGATSLTFLGVMCFLQNELISGMSETSLH